MKWRTVLVVGGFAANVHALLRFSCSGMVVDRLDPLVNPGVVGSPHLHQIVGGNSFAPSMDPNDDLPKKSTCTSCTFTEDFSNYWTQVLFFKHPNGSYKRVPQDKAHSLGNPRGGMTIYYINGEGFGDSTNGSKNMTAFKKGFRMLTGDPLRRTMDMNSAEAKKLTYRCFDAQRSGGTQGAAPGEGISTGQDTYEMPNKPCPGGIRAQLYFPTCWDGTNLDSPDHKSHVAYSTNRRCPSTHPVRIPQLLYEIIWDTSSFNSMWKSGDPNPFVWSMADPTGYGQHGDYVFGWEGDSLQRAMETCTTFAGTPCNALKKQTPEVANTCTIKAKVVGEDTDQWISALPGLGTPSQPPPPGPTTPPAVPSPQPTQPPAPPPPPPAPPGTVPKFGQCGGLGWAGATQCVSGLTCTVLNDFYHQCI